jgi:hypothetical protein
MKPELTTLADGRLGPSMSCEGGGPIPGSRTLAGAVDPALVRVSGALLGCMAALGAAIWLGIIFEASISLDSDRYHVAAICFAIVALAPSGWWLLLWVGAFRGKGWAAIIACILPFMPPMAWALPALAGIPGILIYNFGRSLSRS